MSRPTKGDRATKARPRRQASKTHYFKYQLVSDPTRAEEIDLKRALQQSLEDQQNNNKLNGSASSPLTINPSTTSIGSQTSPPAEKYNLKLKRESKNYAYAKMTALNVNTNKVSYSNNNSAKANSHSKKPPSDNGVKATKLPHANRISPVPKSNAIKTFEKNISPTGQNMDIMVMPKASFAPSSFGGSVFLVPLNASGTGLSLNGSVNTHALLTFSTTPSSPSLSNQFSDPLSVPQQSREIMSVSNITKSGFTSRNSDCSSPSVSTSSPDVMKHSNSYKIRTARRKSPQTSWSLVGVAEERLIYVRDDEQPRRVLCYPAIRHAEGDMIQVRDSVLVRSGARKTDLPYIAKICALWEDSITGGVMMSVLWYYRPEHTEDGRKAHHLPEEVFASRHRDMDSVECIEDKCYVLTFNEYCRYRKRCKMEQVEAPRSLAERVIPGLQESYYRKHRIPDSDVNPELVFCCRQIYDSRYKKLIKNPLINSKYGHI